MSLAAQLETFPSTIVTDPPRSVAETDSHIQNLRKSDKEQKSKNEGSPDQPLKKITENRDSNPFVAYLQNPASNLKRVVS